MLTASKLKKTNIAEYLLYMWQIEDLIRALQLDMHQIEKCLIHSTDVADRKAEHEWYESLIDMMLLENKREKGHLQININVLNDLHEFHLLLLKSGQAPEYNGKFMFVLPLINQLRMKSEEGLCDVELCLNFQYLFLLMKMKKTEISKETADIQVEFAKLLVLLTKNYHAFQNGQLDLE